MEERGRAGLWEVEVVAMGGRKPRTVSATDFKLQNLSPHLLSKKETDSEEGGEENQEKKKGWQGRRRGGRKKQGHKGVRN